jgi:hypothetical protein
MGFSWFRWILYAAFYDNQLWFIVWEEVTEFLFIAGTLYLLLAFRTKARDGT